MTGVKSRRRRVCHDLKSVKACQHCELRIGLLILPNGYAAGVSRGSCLLQVREPDASDHTRVFILRGQALCYGLVQEGLADNCAGS